MPDIDYAQLYRDAQRAWYRTPSTGGADWAAAADVIREAVEAAHAYHTILSASWQRPTPAWDGALVIADSTGDVLWRDADGRYRGGAGSDCDRLTAAEVEREYGPCRVLIDADGHAGADHE